MGKKKRFLVIAMAVFQQEKILSLRPLGYIGCVRKLKNAAL